MLSELRRVRVLDGVVIVLCAAGLTFAGLRLTTSGEGDRPEPVAAHTRTTTTSATQTTTTAASKDSVGSLEVGADGQVTVSGSVPEPPTATAAQSAARSATKPAAKARPAAAPTAAPASGPTRGSLATQVGQMIVSPVAGMTADAALLARVRAGEVGSVILFANNISTVPQVRALVSALQDAARAGGHPPLLVMTDQEGGVVKRFRSAPPTLSAAAIGASARPGALARAQGRSTATALRERGVNVDLAPVADVPVGPSFLTTRAFSRRAPTVAAAACQFAAGLAGGKVGASLKHFPGLGRAGNVNTDAAPVTIRGLAATDLGAYRQCANAAGTMVMMANAAYAGLTGGQPAVVAPEAYKLLRDELGFTGAAISDSLNAGAVRSVPDLAVRAARAGVDLELWTSVDGAHAAYQQLLAAAKSGRLSRDRVADAARRVRALKRFVGTA